MDNIVVKVIYPPYCSNRIFRPMMFGKFFQRKGADVIQFRKDTLLYEPSTGRCYRVLDDLDVDEWIQTPPTDQSNVVVPTNKSLLCNDHTFSVKPAAIEQIAPIPVIFHAKRFNIQLQDLDYTFPSVTEIDILMERCGDMSVRKVTDTETVAKLAKLSLMLERRMSRVGY